MNITQIPIPGTNYWPGRAAQVDTIVYHWIDGTQAVADIVFKTYGKQLSAHFSVEDESVHQYVKLQDTAFHARSANSRSVGIEHSAQPGRYASEATYETSAQLVAQIARQLGKRVGDLRHLPHNAIVATQCPGTLDIDRIVHRAMDIEAFWMVPSAPRSLDAITGVLASAPSVNVEPKTFWAEVIVPKLRVRVAPDHNSPDRPDKLLSQGDEVEFTEVVGGSDPYADGRNRWLKTKRSGLYIWAGATRYPVHLQTTNS